MSFVCQHVFPGSMTYSSSGLFGDQSVLYHPEILCQLDFNALDHCSDEDDSDIEWSIHNRSECMTSFVLPFAPMTFQPIIFCLFVANLFQLLLWSFQAQEPTVFLNS